MIWHLQTYEENMHMALKDSKKIMNMIQPKILIILEQVRDEIQDEINGMELL